MSCKSMQVQIHEYLDGELEREEEQRLKEHLSSCTTCQQHLLELEKTVALVQSLPRVRLGSEFTATVISCLPKVQKRKAVFMWMRQHPLLVAASIFVFMMFSSSALSWYGGDRQLQISADATESHSLFIEGDHVVVPADQVIDGDLVVRHGNITVHGQVKGDVIAIDGRVVLASTAHISGKQEEINDLMQWIWYKIKSFGVEVVNP